MFYGVQCWATNKHEAAKVHVTEHLLRRTALPLGRIELEMSK